MWQGARTGAGQRGREPIWIAEFCPADWNATSTEQENFNAAQVETVVRELLPQLDALPRVQRFAYFDASPTDPNLGHSVLYDGDGGLTEAGEVYMAYPFAAP